MNRRTFLKLVSLTLGSLPFIGYRFETPAPAPHKFTPADVKGLTVWYDANDASSYVYNADGTVAGLRNKANPDGEYLPLLDGNIRLTALYSRALSEQEIKAISKYLNS